MRNVVKALLIGLLAIVTIGVSVYTSCYLVANYYEPEEVKIVERADIKPSYDYLKSVTVLIHGVGDYPSNMNEEDLRDLKRKYQIEEEINETVQWMGTGVIVKIKDGYTYILTNAHVTGNELENVVLFVENEQQKVEAELVERHTKLDIAVIKVKGRLKDKTVIKGVAQAKPQDKIYLVGHHLGTTYIYGEGVFAGYVSVYDKLQVPCMRGNSGSGVFDKNGKLIAIVFAISGQQIGFFPVYDVAHAIAIDGLSIEIFLDKIDEIN